MSKKTTVILIVVVSALILALGIFLLFFTAPSIQPKTDGQSSNSPFGNYNGSSTTSPTAANETPVTPTEPNTGAQYINNPNSALIRISTNPIAGAQVFDRKVSGTTTSIVRYIERATGHTEEYNRSIFTLSTASNTTIPGIYQAWWSGNTVLAQSLGQNKDTIRTFTASLPATTTPTTQLTGSFLTDNIYTLAISPKGNRVFTLTKEDGAIGSISNLDGSKKITVLNFPFNEWSTQWPNENTITLTSKASFGATGYMYFLSTSGVMTKALGNMSGLTTLTSPNLGYTIYSSSQGGGLSTGIYDFTKNISLAFNNNGTLPEKCVWSKLSKTTAYCAVPANVPIGNYPDDWYQGNVSFVDNIYKIDLSLQTVKLIYKLPADQAIDATNLFLDSKEETLYFTNKNDYYLWGLTLKGLLPINI